MAVIKHKININRSVSDIFRFVSNFANTPKWQPASVSLERSGQLKLAEMIVGSQKFLGRKQFVNADVVDYIPNQKIEYSGVMGGYPFRTTYKFDFSNNGTDVLVTTEVTLRWWSFLVKPFIVRAVDSQSKAALENLKQVMEARQDLA